mmetsp:Transcript_61244/g.189768  ORF Transcript_61244/g.189768 Transcript_61244/m.189768 type:complete len:413 (+) Transcript_61244:198-1436(+)
MTPLCSCLLNAGLWVGTVIAMIASANSGSVFRFAMCLDMKASMAMSMVLLPTVCKTALDSATALGAHWDKRPHTYATWSCTSCLLFITLKTRLMPSASSAVFLAPECTSSSSAGVPMRAETNSPPFLAVRPVKSNFAEVLAITASRVLQSATPRPETLPSTTPMTYMGNIQKRKSICWSSSSSAGTSSPKPEQNELPSAYMHTKRTLPTLLCSSKAASNSPCTVALSSLFPASAFLSLMTAMCWPARSSCTVSCSHISLERRAGAGRPVRPHLAMTSFTTPWKSTTGPVCMAWQPRAAVGTSSSFVRVPPGPVVLSFLISSCESFATSAPLAAASSSAARMEASAEAPVMTSSTMPMSLPPLASTSSDMSTRPRAFGTPIFERMPCQDMQKERALVDSMKLRPVFFVSGAKT